MMIIWSLKVVVSAEGFPADILFVHVNNRLIQSDTSNLNLCLSLPSAFQTVPPLSVTANKFMSSFLGIGSHWSGISKRSFRNEDVVVVIDGSESIGSCEFDKGKKALVNMMGKMEKPGYDTRYAAVTFSSSSKVNFKFTPSRTAASKIMNIPYPGEGTNTQAGLAEAKRLLFDDLSSGTI